MNIKLLSVFALVLVTQTIFSQKTLTSNPAIDKTDEAVNMEEKFADAKRELYVGKLDKAIDMLEELYKEDRNNSTVAFELVKAYDEKNDFLKVEKFAKTALDNSPNNTWMLQYIAQFMTKNNRPATAFNHYQKLISLEPKNRSHYENAALSLLKQDKTQEAINIYNTLELQIGPLADIYIKRYELYNLLNNDAAAIKEIDALIKRYPNEKKYLKIKALHLSKQNKTEEAIALFKKVLTIDAEDIEANLAILGKGDNKDKPNAYLMSLIPLITNKNVSIDVKVKELLPYIQNFAKGNNEDVKTSLLDLADKLVLTHPEDAKAYSLQGDVLMISGNLPSAINTYEKTLSINNKNYAIWEQLMFAYFETQNYDALDKLSSKAIDIFPNQAINYFFASLSNTHKKDITNAISLAEEGLLINGGNKVNAAKLNTALASAFVYKKDYDKAQSCIDKAFQISDNKYAFAFEIQGDLYMAKSDKSKAQDSWIQSQQLGNKSKRLAEKLVQK